MTSLHVVVMVMLSMLAVACGGGSKTAAGKSPSSSPTPSSTAASPSGPPCSPSGTSIEVSSEPNVLNFDTQCLAAPAGQAFTITFHNNSPTVPHDVSIATEGLVNVLFEGKVVTGPKTITYSVKALDAGTYTFYCKIHPSQMNGTFVVA